MHPSVILSTIITNQLFSNPQGTSDHCKLNIKQTQQINTVTDKTGNEKIPVRPDQIQMYIGISNLNM